ncbi:proton-conducting transporter transmembrane domain-containing protein [Streptosporangium saharense]|uniref:NADH:ubiquinone oxidoreductase subunit 5 (Subunit L)/multisubunit Na+/H+ antiporter MnhA subunit n=1 Tax=Streptosporangium saharense TaxID=1706840 RepID=A0A7W7QT94_9ACTN|nr:proton-conducting transporter membrane subunit [Streptosporangium saharense]MBB4919360.1 NADH:ubiquinone oxidoreductase subunit 5 (subunit L)/multisubunit Na+/H+ antiporter MnhA subunit [Streptosporangium saharense]
MSALPWLLPALPGLAGVALLVTGRGADRVAPVAAVAVTAVALVLAVLAALTRPAATTPLFAGLRAGLAVDGLSSVLVVTVCAVAAAILVFAAGDTGEVRRARARFFGLMLLFTAAMLVTVTATDLALLLAGWEVMGAMSYALIGFVWRDGSAVRSAEVAFVTTRAGDVGLYVAAGCALAGTGSLELAGLADGARPWRDLVAAGVVAAALGKSAQLPLSFWLSRAMVGPSPVSALLHSATMVAAGAYLLLRLRPLLAATGWAMHLVAWAGALTALLLGVVALAQRDLKQLLAASTCAQLGFMVMAAGVGALAGGAAHLVAHAAVKSLLFLCAGVWLAALGTRDLGKLRGAARRDRVVGVSFGVGALALGGVPPLSLWVTKESILTVAARWSPWLYAVALAAALLSAAYAAKAVAAVWASGDVRGWRRPGPLERLPLPVLALAAATFGLVGLPPVFDAWRRLLGADGEPGPGAGGLLLAGVLALAVTAAGLKWRVPWSLPGARDWLGLERAASFLVVRPVMALARSLARFDDRVIDGAVNGVGRAGTALARLLREKAEAGVDGLVRDVGTGTGELAVLARRPQTGLVHTYLAQAAVWLLLLAVVIALTGWTC